MRFLDRLEPGVLDGCLIPMEHEMGAYITRHDRLNDE